MFLSVEYLRHHPHLRFLNGHKFLVHHRLLNHPQRNQNPADALALVPCHAARRTEVFIITVSDICIVTRLIRASNLLTLPFPPPAPPFAVIVVEPYVKVECRHHQPRYLTLNRHQRPHSRRHRHCPQCNMSYIAEVLILESCSDGLCLFAVRTCVIAAYSACP